MLALCTPLVWKPGAEGCRDEPLGELGDADAGGVVTFSSPPGHAEAESGGDRRAAKGQEG